MSVMPQAVKTLIFALLVTAMLYIVASIARADILLVARGKKSITMLSL